MTRKTDFATGWIMVMYSDRATTVLSSHKLFGKMSFGGNSWTENRMGQD